MFSSNPNRLAGRLFSDVFDGLAREGLAGEDHDQPLFVPHVLLYHDQPLFVPHVLLFELVMLRKAETTKTTKYALGTLALAKTLM